MNYNLILVPELWIMGNAIRMAFGKVLSAVIIFALQYISWVSVHLQLLKKNAVENTLFSMMFYFIQSLSNIIENLKKRN